MDINYNLEDTFKEFMQACYPTLKPWESQWIESRKAFYTGCIFIFDRFVRISNDFPKEEWPKRLWNLHEQFESFLGEIKKEAGL